MLEFVHFLSAYKRAANRSLHNYLCSRCGRDGRGYLAENAKLDRIENSEHKGKAGDGQFLKR